MIIHPLFPTLVTEHVFDGADHFNSNFRWRIAPHINDGFADEAAGVVDLHTDRSFDQLFIFITKSIKLHLEQYNVDSSLFDINIVKTWMNINIDEQNQRHAHKDAHISFVYYVNVPDQSRMLRLFRPTPHPEPFPGLWELNNKTQEWGHLNCTSWTLVPQQGSMFVFPAMVFHDTLGVPGSRKPITEDWSKYRIALAGDAVLTYKEKQAKHLGLQPVKNWRTFDVDE